jgi:putative membrane protein
MMMGFGLIFILLVIGVVAYVMRWRPQQYINQLPIQSSQQTPMEILNTRYARGEISREEYQQLRSDLEK